MQKLIAIILCLLVIGNADAQSLKKYAINKSGCSAYFFCDPGVFKMEKSPDSSEVYTGECNNNDVGYGIICVKLKDKIEDLKVSEDVLISYMDYLKTSLNITDAVGYGKGHRLKEKEDTRGVIDYWKDKEGDNMKVKGWTNGKYIAVMYVYTKQEVPDQKANVFFESLLFPGM